MALRRTPRGMVNTGTRIRPLIPKITKRLRRQQYGQGGGAVVAGYVWCVDNDGTNYGYVRGDYGSITPDTTRASGTEIDYVYVSDTDTMHVGFEMGAYLPGISTFIIDLPNGMSFPIYWDMDHHEYNGFETGLTVYAQSLQGTCINIEITHLDHTAVMWMAAFNNTLGEMQTQLIGQGTPETDHSMPMLAPDHEGTYVEFGVDEPVWAYGRVTGPIGSRVVHNTDDVGDYLIPQPYLVEQEEATNLCLNPEQEASQNITLSAAGTYTLLVFGDGASATVSAGTATGTGFGTSTPDVPVEIDITGTGTVSIVATAPLAINFLAMTAEEALSVQPITTGGATTGPLKPQFDAANHDNNDGAYYTNVDNTGDDVVLMSDGLYDFLRIEDGGSVDEVVNGGFDTDTNWTKGTGWSISGGQAVCDGTQTNSQSISQTGVFTELDVPYVFEVYVSDITAGAFRIFGHGAASDYYATAGLIRIFLTPTGGTTYLIQGDANFIGAIDYTTVKKVDGKYLKLTDGTNQLQLPIPGPNYVLNGKFIESLNHWNTSGTDGGNTVTWSNGRAFMSTTSLQTSFMQTGLLNIGTDYVLDVDIEIVAGDVNFLSDGTDIALVDGHNTVPFTSSMDGVLFRRGATNITQVYFDNVVVREATPTEQAKFFSVGAVYEGDVAGVNQMNLNIDGVWAGDTPYDGSLGTGDIVLGETQHAVTRYQGGTYQEKKDKIDERMP